jgi:hypothetical protein
MSEESLLSGARNAVLFTALGVVALVVGFTVVDSRYLRWMGAVIAVGGFASLGGRRLGASERTAAAPAAFAAVVVGGLITWRGVRLGSPFWVALGLGIAIPLALLMLFPDRVALACGLLTATFGGAGVLTVANGALPTGLVLLGWAVGFAWVGYQNRPAPTD